MPPLTVASLATITHSRPLTRPIPAMTPAAGACPSYIPSAARGASLRKGEPGSRRVSTRSRGSSFPRAVRRARALAAAQPGGGELAAQLLDECEVCFLVDPPGL
ncbi:hypothetical protein SALBM311S_12139 [Streptomyces alboniger]